MKTPVFAALLVLGSLLGASTVSAQSGTRDQVRAIEQEYARQSNGRMISDEQLEYYLDRRDAGWSMDRIGQDMANSRRQFANNPWRPQAGWIAREVICSSNDNQYRECQAPFRGDAVVTQQLSQSACIEGRSWGHKPGKIWVSHGCRARFGITSGNAGNRGNQQIVACRSNDRRYRECNTQMRGRVELVAVFPNSASCIEGRTWGQRQGVVWVSRGCSARFAAAGGRGRNGNGNWGDNNGWQRDDNYAVSCSSNDGRRTRCTWDGRYNSPRMVQQLSSSACVEGRTWGYDSREGLWVDSGCRARFASR